jgi:hypothetical protein
MGLLADIFSYGDGLKRKVNGLLQDPAGTASLGATRFGEDQDSLINLFSNAYPMAGDKTVLNTPQQRGQMQQEASNRALESFGGLLGTVGKVSAADYRGLHTAPMKDSGAPLHDLTKIYPDDIYSNNAAQYYGHYGNGSAADARGVAMMQAAKDRPNMLVTMYRAVPHEPSVQERLALLQKQMDQFQRRGNAPKDATLSGSAWYNDAWDQREKLKAMADQPSAPIGINNGDWVTLSREYAKEHGTGALNGKYKIVSKKVPARKLFTDGNSIHEFGYDESGKASLALLGLLGGGTAAGLGAYQALKD